MKIIIFVSILYSVLSNGAQAAGVALPLSCENMQSMHITQDSGNLVVQTEFTYPLFDSLFKGIYPGRLRIPGDEHSAKIFILVPITACSETEIGISCHPDPSATVFTSDVLTDWDKIGVVNLELTSGTNIDLHVQVNRFVLKNNLSYLELWSDGPSSINKQPFLVGKIPWN